MAEHEWHRDGKPVGYGACPNLLAKNNAAISEKGEDDASEAKAGTHR
jgi:hypothetical protein